MIALAERKQIALQAKIASLHAEFGHWSALSEPGAAFEKHQTQIIALIGHLEGLWVQTRDIFEEAQCSGSVLAQSPNIESLLLGLRRIWEFFRAKLAQRHDPEMRKFLRAADELSWACYEPVLARYPGARRQPPLVFLNGGLSPYALARDQAFSAEPVPGETLGGVTYAPILRRLPIAVIGVPWHQVAHLPDLPVVAHETGHAVEQDFSLLPALVANLVTELGAGAPRLAHWQAWSREVFADLWGCLMLGPSYASSLADFLASDPVEINNQVASETARYPPAHLRMLLCFQALVGRGFAAQTQALLGAWMAAYQPVSDPGFIGDAPAVVTAMLGRRLVDTQFEQPLFEVDDLGMTLYAWERVQAAVGELSKKKLQSTTTILTWTAAARAAYDASPSAYAAHGHARTLIDFSERLIDPGTRMRTSALACDALRQQSTADAKQWFDDFARWSGTGAMA